MSFTIYLYIVQCILNTNIGAFNLCTESLKENNSYFVACPEGYLEAGQKKQIQPDSGRLEGGKEGSLRHRTSQENVHWPLGYLLGECGYSQERGSRVLSCRACTCSLGLNGCWNPLSCQPPMCHALAEVMV